MRASFFVAPKKSRQLFRATCLSKGLQEKMSTKASSYFVKVWMDIWEKSMAINAVIPGFSGIPFVTIGPAKMFMFIFVTKFSIKFLVFRELFKLRLQFLRSQII